MDIQFISTTFDLVEVTLAEMVAKFTENRKFKVSGYGFYIVDGGVVFSEDGLTEQRTLCTIALNDISVQVGGVAFYSEEEGFNVKLYDIALPASAVGKTLETITKASEIEYILNTELLAQQNS